MLNIIRRNKYRQSYMFTKRSVKIGALSDVPANDLRPIPYRQHIEMDLVKIEKEFNKKIKKCRDMDLNGENRSMFDADIENSKVRPLSILQGQVGVNQRMINEVVLNTLKNNEINEKSLEEKIKQRDEIKSDLEDAILQLEKRDKLMTEGKWKYEEGEHDA